MPQYKMPGAEDPQFTALSDFVKGYVECALFCGVERSEDDPEADHSTIDDAHFSEIDSAALECMADDCEKFQARAAALLCQAYQRDDYDVMQAGRDFWFTRNGHGVGYWDRDQLKDDDLGNRLSEACKVWGETTLYYGDDGMIHGS